MGGYAEVAGGEAVKSDAEYESLVAALAARELEIAKLRTCWPDLHSMARAIFDGFHSDLSQHDRDCLWVSEGKCRGQWLDAAKAVQVRGVIPGWSARSKDAEIAKLREELEIALLAIKEHKREIYLIREANRSNALSEALNNANGTYKP